MKKCLVSIIIPTLGRESLYPLVSNLLKQKVNFCYEIILIPQVALKEKLLKDKRIRLFYEESGKGFTYYRNIGIKASKAKIVVFIDDDEIPTHLNWLHNMTEPIILGKEEFVTAQYIIKLGGGYLTDCTSLLGFPGGGAAGFEIMWPLKEKDYTYHLISGNMALKKSIFKKIGLFNINLKLRNDDTEFNQRVEKAKIKIRYLKNEGVYHAARKGYISIVKWFILRGKSAYEINNIVKKRSDLVRNRFASSFRILEKVLITKYILGVLFMMFNQYLFEFIGYMLERVKTNE